MIRWSRPLRETDINICSIPETPGRLPPSAAYQIRQRNISYKVNSVHISMLEHRCRRSLINIICRGAVDNPGRRKSRIRAVKYRDVPWSVHYYNRRIRRSGICYCKIPFIIRTGIKEYFLIGGSDTQAFCDSLKGLNKT